ncbi:hypothetical protein AB0D49_12360 [Streptomyces sp. NPDC048290]|uniref:hypothetical protein n=1 Tax=Streptomyces sp. NPDC048290 TaxID=3155811 RepID=UPI00343AD346
MSFHFRAIIVSAIVLTGVTMAGVSIASAENPRQSQADSAPPVAVEDYNYPDAGRILAEQGIKLKRGDGGILLTDCDRAADQLEIMTIRDDSVGRRDSYCFTTQRANGWLTLELPRVFGIDTAGRGIQADLTTGGQTTSVAVPKDTFKSVGEGVPGGAHATLVELRVTG